MAVMDFREGGYVFSRHKMRREFAYDQIGWDGEISRTDDSRFAADPDGADSLSVRLARLTHYLGALASVGLMVGLIVWGFQLVSRDVSGVPVIRAIDGEARTAPDDPGGELTSYTGYAVNGVAAGAEAVPTEKVAIAPGATELAEEDLAMGDFGAIAREPANPSDVPLSFDGEPVTPLSDSEAKAIAEAEFTAAAERALADAAVQQADIIDAPAAEGPVNEVVTDENGAPAQADAITAALAQAQAEANPGVLASSSRPARRPREAVVVAAASTASAPAAAETRPAQTPETAPAPAAVSAGGPLVQIGAFDSNSVAQSEWNRVSGKFGSLFAGKGQVIQKHEANGRTFWRLRVAGFGSTSDARSFCAAMKAGGTDCIALSGQ